LTVTITFPRPLFDGDDFFWARETIRLARHGEYYQGPSQPGWYGNEALRDLLAAAPKGARLDKVIEDAFAISDTEPAADLSWTAAFIADHATGARESNGAIGELGENAIGGYYGKAARSLMLDGALIPFCVETWVRAEHAGKDDNPYPSCIR
jgi:hypothetical protein